MTQSNDTEIKEIIIDIDNGKIQLPEFQRDWIWDDIHIKALIASISNNHPIGAVMFLNVSGSNKTHFKSRLFDGVNRSNSEPNMLVLDGQQRLTSIYRSMLSKTVVNTMDTQKKKTNRYYYLNILKCLDPNVDRIDAVISVPEDKIIKENIGRDIKLDLSTQNNEYKEHLFPLNIIFDPGKTMEWYINYYDFHKTEEAKNNWKSFYTNIVEIITHYKIPVIKLNNDMSKEAICQIFENVNQGGVSLTIFELVTATFAAEGLELRKEWDTIWNELKKHEVIKFKDKKPSFNNTDFLTAITLLNSYYQFKNGCRQGLSCKRKDVLNLKASEFNQYKDQLIKGIKDAINFIKEQSIYTSVDLPYTAQLIPLSVIYAIDRNLWFDNTNKEKLTQWYWCGVFGELYGSASETRYALDIQDLIKWIKNDEDLPDTVIRSNFHVSRLYQLTTRNSAAYKGIIALILKNPCKDFIAGTDMNFVNYIGEATDIHHIFPEKYCEQQHYDKSLWNSVINKTPIYARTNKIIGGTAPSKYIERIEKKHNVKPSDLDIFMSSHLIDVTAIRTDNFETYIKKRANSIYDLIEKVTGKPVTGRENINQEIIIENTSTDTEEEIYI